MFVSYLCLLAAVFFWGTSFVAGKFALEAASPAVIVLLRFALAAAFWMPAFGKAWRRLSARERVELAGLSFLMLPATFLLQFIGLEYTSASSAVLVIGFEPLLIVLVGHFFWKERAGNPDVLLGIAAFLGVLLVMGRPEGARFLGCLLVFAATFVVAIWVRWSKAWLRRLDAASFSALTAVVGCVLLLPCLPFVPGSWHVAWSPAFVGALLYLGLGCSLAAGWLWNRGLAGVRPNAGGFFLALEPVFGVVFAGWCLAERLRGAVLEGACLVLLAAFLSAAIPLWRREPDAA